MPRMMTRDTFHEIERLIADGLRDIDIGERLNLNGSTIRKVRLGKHSLQTGRVIGRQYEQPPTPEEIKAMCVEIRRHRHEPEPEGWMPQEVRALGFGYDL